MKIEIEELRAWVDGELDEQRSRVVGEMVDSDPDMQVLVSRLRASRLQYKQAFEKKASPAMPDSLQQTVNSLRNQLQPSPSRRSLFPVTAAASVLVAALAGYFVGSRPGMLNSPDRVAAMSPVEGFASTVAAYQSLYVRETVSGIEAGDDKVTGLSARLLEQSDLKVQVPDLEALGYTFVRGQQLAFDGKPLVQLIYLPAEGLPLALCFMIDEGSETPLVLEKHFGLSTAEWRQQNKRFVMVSDASENAMSQLYRAAMDQWEI